MKTHFYFGALLLIISSCTKNQNVKILEISNLPGKDKLLLSELCSEIKYLPLDTSKNIFVSRSHNYEIVDDLLFVFEYQEIKRITAYNIQSGKQLFEIANIGHGPEEMAFPVAFYVDIERKRIEIFDSMKRKFFFYDLNGVFLKSVYLGLFIVDFNKNKNNDYFFYTGRAINSTKDKKFSETLIITDSTFKIKNSFFESNPNLEKLFIRSTKNFSWHNGELYFLHSPDSYLYKVNENSVNPVLSLDFKENNIPDDLKQNKADLKLSEWVSIVRDKGYYMGISNHFGNDKFELINFSSLKNREHYYIKYDRSKNLYNHYSEINIYNDIDNGLFGELIHLDNNRLITLIEPYQLLDHIKRTPEFKNKNLEKLLNRKKRFDNPILMIYQLK